MYDRMEIINEIYEWEDEYKKLIADREDEEAAVVKNRIDKLRNILDTEI